MFDTLVNNLEGMAYRCLIDPQWTMVFVSQGCMALTGYAPSELSGDGVVSWEQITHPHDRMRVRAVVQAAGDSGQRFHVEYRITTRGGELRRVIERGVGVSDEQGERVIEGFIEDITVRHATLEALEHAELRYRHIFEHASEGIFQTTREGQYLAANPALARIYGYATPQALMADLSDIEIDNKLTLSFKFRLDVSQLPRPFQMMAGSQAEWNLSAQKMMRLSADLGR